MKESRKPFTKHLPKKEKPNKPPRLRDNNRVTDDRGPAKSEDKALHRREYDRTRNTSPERRGYQRRLAKERRQKAKDLGICRHYNEQAILGQTRCPTCAGSHRQSLRRSGAKRRATAKAMPAAER